MNARPSTQPDLTELGAVYRSEVRALYGFLWRSGAQEADMQDLVHDVFLTAARRWESYDRRRPVRPWLFGIAFRVLSDSRRKRGSSAVGQLEVPVATDQGGDEVVALRQAQALMQRALATLSEERRVAFVLVELEGLSVREAAELMSAPVPTTYSRVTQARDEVAQAVRRFELVAEARRPT